VLRMHGNELRKAGHAAASMTRLWQSLQLDDRPGHRGAALVLLARAAAESGRRTCSTRLQGSASKP
jgi:hypothetical protein